MVNAAFPPPVQCVARRSPSACADARCSRPRSRPRPGGRRRLGPSLNRLPRGPRPPGRHPPGHGKSLTNCACAMHAAVPLPSLHKHPSRAVALYLHPYCCTAGRHRPSLQAPSALWTGWLGVQQCCVNMRRSTVDGWAAFQVQQNRPLFDIQGAFSCQCRPPPPRPPLPSPR